MARTVGDLVALLDVIAGFDEADPATENSKGHIPESYGACLNLDGARGKRIGILRQAFAPEESDPQVRALVDQAVQDLGRAGAIIIDPFEIPEFENFLARPHPASVVREALEAYLATTGPEFPKSLAQIVEAGKFHPLHEVGLRATVNAPPPGEDPILQKLETDEILMRGAYMKAMEKDALDAFILPVATYPPKLNGDRNVTPAGASTWIASGLHWPAAAVPMGYTYEDLPSGLQIVGQPWSEPTLIEIAYAYEQATAHRHPPSTVPPLG